MDGHRFDRLTKTLAGGAPTRRGVLCGVAVALASGLLGGRGATAQTCREPGRLCREYANCCSGLCGAKDATGRRRCQCRTAADCPATTNTCLTSTCDAGLCGTTAAVTCVALDQCHLPGVCSPATGLCSNPPKANDSPCDDGDPCTRSDTCRAGVCTPGAPVSCPTCRHCVGGTCANDDGAPCAGGTCQGGACLPSPAGGPCAVDADCTTHACSGATCQQSHPAGPCAVEADCTTHLCFGDVCRLATVNHPCAINTDCSTNACVGGICQMSNAGGSCLTTIDCTTRDCYVANHVCQQSPAGGHCAVDADCTTNVCIGALCQ